VADLNGDGLAEVIFTTWPQKGGNAVGKPIILSYQGQLLTSVDLPAPRGGNWNGGLAAPQLAQLDADPQLEAVIGTSRSGVVVYQLDNSSNARLFWPTSRGNLLRNGQAIGDGVFGNGFE
jgi:hypothetical protein